MCRYKNKNAIIYGKKDFLLSNITKLPEINVLGFCDECIIQTDFDINYPLILRSEINLINPDYIFIASENYIESIDKLNDILKNDKIIIEPLVKKTFLNEIKDILFNKSNFFKKTLQLLSLNPYLKPFIYKIYRKLSARDVNKFINHKIKKNTVLITDPNDCHGEIIFGTVKYFLDLNYFVDILITKKKYKNLKGALDKNSKVKVFNIGITKYEKALQSKAIKNYDSIIFTSSRFYFEAEKYGFKFIPDFLKINADKEKIILIEHRLDELKEKDKSNYKIAALPYYLNDKEIKTVNPVYFKKIKEKKKNKKTCFIVVGANEIERKNFSLIDSALENLKERNDFEIIIIGAKYNKQDKRLKVLGKTDFKKLFYHLEQADYILALLDSNIPSHNRYLKYASSGTFQLSYGFRIPVLIEEKFALPFGLSDKNAIVYKNGEFIPAIKEAIDKKNYNIIRENLSELNEEIYKRSLENLKLLLKIK